jgi:ATPase subunit of ABC transporter with duplicated ATPase domains
MSRLLICCSHLYKSFGLSLLFDDVSFAVNEREIFALIGENGAGKTTLLQLLQGEVQPDAGDCIRASHLSIGFLPQEVSLKSSDMSARAYLEEGPLPELERQMAAYLDAPDQLAEWAACHEKYEQLGGYRRLPIEKVLSGLDLDLALLDVPMASLSSGQRVRVALARALIENPDLLLLDEPTNHLDQSMVDWLQMTLRQREGATIIVSHDRTFLNETCNRLIELKQGRLSCYGGNYDFYLEEQKLLMERQIRAYEAQEEERAALKQKIKAMSFSKRKASSPTDRNVMAYDRRGENHQKSLQHSLSALKARLTEIEDNPLSHPKPKTIKGLRFAGVPLASVVAIECDHISKAYDGKLLFAELSRTLCKGDRIVLTGSNGSGKTTFLRCLAGLLPVDAGLIRTAPTAVISYLDQDIALLPMSETPLQYFQSKFHLSEEELRRELHKAAIGGSELLNRPFATLSTGQRKRLMILSLVLERPNVLLLDEPTNHLDLLTLEALETAILSFEGGVLAVSHDQTFINKIATEVLEFR